jgi:hypothetical protein
MRDLGQMGESTFNLLCGQVGLTCNGSRIDRTGWDFFVEFPFKDGGGVNNIHTPAIECKIQVKATDKKAKKLPIKLSNLRRLITAPTPAFFVFIEFDGRDEAQRAFFVHVDKDLISRTLKRIHELESINGVTDHNKRYLTVRYGAEHELAEVTGSALRDRIESYVPNGLAAYVAQKNDHLASTGFENGFAQITFTTQSAENLIDLIDVSIGLKNSTRVSSFKGFDSRFGIKSKFPFLNSETGTLEMPNLKPTKTGIICFREDTLSPGLKFPCRLYSSPLNAMLPRELVKIRIESDCFDISCNPYTGASEYRFNAGTGVRLAVSRLRDVMRLLFFITSSAKLVLTEVSLDGMPKWEFAFNALDEPFEHLKVLNALNAAVKICSYFEVSESIELSMEEVARYADSIIHFGSVLDSDQLYFRVEFSTSDEDYDCSKATACICLVSARIGSQVFGFILALTGSVLTSENGGYSLLATKVKIERKVMSDGDGPIRREDVVQAVEAVARIYESDFEVVTVLN